MQRKVSTREGQRREDFKQHHFNNIVVFAIFGIAHTSWNHVHVRTVVKKIPAILNLEFGNLAINELCYEL